MKAELAGSFIIVVAMFFAMCQETKADELWIHTDLGSYHFDRNWDWNETHTLLSAEWVFDSYSVTASSFINSFNEQTYGIQFGKEWIEVKGFAYSTSIGLTYGYKARYYSENNDDYEYFDNGAYLGGGYSLMAVQSVSYEYSRFKVATSLLGLDAILFTVGFKLF